jgi:lipoic acid synthetase
MLVETLLGDFQGHLDYVDITVDAKPDVWAHNVEVVKRLQRTIRDVRCSYEQSLRVLRRAKERDPARITKSSIMVGIGETDDEVLETMRDLREAQVDIVTLGQYLRPSAKHAAVDRFVHPDTFERFADEGRRMGFAYVASGPLVRSSYKAAEAFVRGILRPDDPNAVLAQRMETAQAHGTTLVPASSLVRKS